MGETNSPIRIANCSGFYGDQIDAALRVVEGGPIDALTGDWLAELTMLILARTRAKRPGQGYARTFVTQMEQVMGQCLDRGIKVVSNAGGLDPDNCAEAVAEVADRLGLSPTIAYVNGDTILDRMDDFVAKGIPIHNAETGEAITDSDFISANVYFGCWGIVEALNQGADIVVTGRTTDAAIVAGPAAWHHQWSRNDFDAMAGAVVAGHVIECGTQATGGNYSFFTELEGMSKAGFPIAEVASDGSSVITKHPGTGGAVTVGTVTSQLLYEIDGPGYLGPDVTARFDSIQLDQVGVDRVRIANVKGDPPPETLKVSMNRWGGYRSDLAVALTGLDIEAKAVLLEEIFWRVVPYEADDFDSIDITLTRSDKSDPTSNAEAVAAWRVTAKDGDQRKARSIGKALNAMALASIPGFFGLAGTKLGEPFGVHTSGLVPAEMVPQTVHVFRSNGRQSVFVGTVQSEFDVDRQAPNLDRSPATQDLLELPDGSRTRAPLGLVVGSRSGDKGGNANLGVFVRSAGAYAWMQYELTTERLRELLPEAAEAPIDRHLLPNIWSINFVIHGLLQEGVAASTRLDGQAKSLGEWFRARYVDIPDSLLAEHRNGANKGK